MDKVIADKVIVGELTPTEYTDIIWDCLPINNMEWQALGLCGEAGEFANMIKKQLYKEIPTSEMIEELGDVMWHVSQCAKLLGTTIEHLMVVSAQKTLDRNK